MTDAGLAHVAPKLRSRGIDCETVHMSLRGNEHSEEHIPDREIMAFLRKVRGTITLIASDVEFADHLKYDDLPYITIWDAVAEFILRPKTG